MVQDCPKKDEWQALFILKNLVHPVQKFCVLM